VQTIGTLPPNKRMRRVLPEKQIEGQLDNSTELFYDGPIEMYRKRPKKPEFEKMSLFEFTSWYEKEYNQSNWHRCVPLCDDSAYLKKRLKAQVIRSSYVSMACDDYYYSLLLLHLPHREESDLNDGYGTFKEVFLSKEEQLSTLNLPNEKFVNELLEATRRIRMENEIERLLYVANSETVDDEEEGNIMEVDVIEEGLDPAFSSENYENPMDTNDLDNSERTATHNLLASNWSEETLQANMAKLTKTQLQTLLYIENCITEKKQILLFITGNAGTGKSFLLNVIIEWLRATQSKIVGEDPVIIGAPTGLAAKNVNGRTLHSLFRLPLQDGQATTTAKLNELSMRKLQMEMKSKTFFICDEISMVGEKNFRMVHERLEQLGTMNTNGKNQKPFGGYHIILSGDFYQLPPVRDNFAFECVELFDLFEIIWLTENMRQKKDKKWCNLLDRLRMSTLTKEDCKLLAMRTFPKHECDHQHAEMRLYPTVKMVTAHNESRQSAMKETKRILESTDIYSTFDNYGPGCTASLDDLPEDTRKAGGLLQKLEVSIGTRIMLTRNLLPTLCNGDQGYVTAFETSSENITTGIIIKFDDENAGDELKDSNFDNNVKIEQIDCEYMYKGRIIVRKQFPLMPSWSVTIHKAQGLSLKSAVVNVSNKIFTPGQTYVALSRVQELSGLFIEDGIDLTRIKTHQRVIEETDKWLKKWIILKGKIEKLNKKI
jgi:ATP-dependent exoDNAse (exonuclease V) alpha subunit